MPLKISNFLVIVLLVMFYSLSVNAQELPKSYVIAGITVEGNQFSDEQTIIAISGLRVGDQISIPGDNKIQIAIRNLWNRKQFSDIEIKVDRITPVGIFLIVKVHEYQRLNRVIVENNKEVTQESIAKAVAKNRGDILSPFDVYKIKKNIKDIYNKEGLIFAKITPSMMKTDTNYYSNLKIDIVEGQEYYVKAIDFIGNTAHTSSELASEFKDTHTKHWWQFWRSSKFDLKEYDQDKKLLKDFFQKQGFIDAEIIKDTLMFDEKTSTVKIQIQVNEGQQVFVRNIKFEGNIVYNDELLMKRLDFKKGDYYDKERFNSNLTVNKEFNDALSLYVDNGYLNARLTPEETRVTPDSVDVLIRVIEGDRVTIRRIEIAGNVKTKDKVIRRELYTRPGDYFDRSAIVRSIRALGVMNYFNPEAIKPEVKPVDNTKVDIVYKVEERSTDTFNAAIGFAGSYGLTASVGFTFNNFSFDQPLKGGGGQILNFNCEFGQASRYSSLSLGFTEPWLYDKPTTVGFNIFSTNYNYTYEIKQKGIQVNLGRRFKWPDDYFRGDWSVVVQQNDISKDYVSNYYRPGKSTEIAISQTFSRSSLNNLFFPTSGSKFAWTNTWAMGCIGLGNTDYLKTHMYFDMYQPLIQINGADRVILYLGSQLGYVAGLRNDTTISPKALYRMGGNGLGAFGVTPLRGYDDEAVGPESGGKTLAKHVAEIRFGVSQEQMPVYFYIFGEAGNVWSDLKTSDFFSLKRAAGVGIQLMINPIGIVGFSYGYGFDTSDLTGKKEGWKFLFNLGAQ